MTTESREEEVHELAGGWKTPILRGSVPSFLLANLQRDEYFTEENRRFQEVAALFGDADLLHDPGGDLERGSEAAAENRHYAFGSSRTGQEEGELR